MILFRHLYIFSLNGVYNNIYPDIIGLCTILTRTSTIQVNITADNSVKSEPFVRVWAYQIFIRWLLCILNVSDFITKLNVHLWRHLNDILKESSNLYYIDLIGSDQVISV